MLALCPGLFIHPLTIACGVESAPEPQARFSPTTQSPLLGMYPVGSTRSTTFLPSGVSWAKNCSETIRLHIPDAACASWEFEFSGGRPPLSVRSPLTRQRIEALTWSMLLSDGVTPVSGQFAPAATPPPAFFGLWLAFAGIFPCLSWTCCDFAVARPAEPTRPSAPSAVTAPPLDEGALVTGAGGLAELSPPPPPHPATAMTPARSAAGTAVLISLWIRFSEPSMPRWLSVIGLSPLSA